MDISACLLAKGTPRLTFYSQSKITLFEFKLKNTRFNYFLCVFTLLQAAAPLFSQEVSPKKFQGKYENKIGEKAQKLSKKSQEVRFRGFIKNGTGTELKTIPDLELLHLKGGMRFVEKIKPQKISSQKASFAFSPLSISTEETPSPYLIRAVYKGASYSILIPPQKKFWKRAHILYIYDSGAVLEDLNITSALQVTKKEYGLSVEKIFLVQNNSSPARSFALENIYFFIPPRSKELQASVRYQNKAFPIPLKAISHEKGYHFKHGLRPGQAELTIRYKTSDYQLKDRRWKPFYGAKSRQTQVLLWRPPDAVPKVKGAKYSSINIPNVGPAYQIEHKPGSELSYDFSLGSVIIEDPLRKDRNPLFDRPEKTLAALFVILIYFLLLTRFLAPKKFFREENARSE